MAKLIKFPGRERGQRADNVYRGWRPALFRSRLYIVCLVFVLVFAIVIAYYVYENTKIYETVSVSQSIAKENVSMSETLALGENILTYSKDGANCMDNEGNLLWNMTFGMQNPMYSICNETVAFADYGAREIFVHTKAGVEAEINTNMPIRKITVSEKGIVAAVLEDTEITWIYMYDINGSEIAYFRTTMEKSGYPVDVNISPTGELVGVSYYYLDSGEIHSSVAFFNFGEVGKNYIDNYVSGFNYDKTLVPLVKFMDNDTVFAASTSRISIYEGDHKPVSISEMLVTDTILSIYNDSSRIGIIYQNNSSEGKYRLEVLDSKGSLLSKKYFDFDYTGVVFGRDCYVVYGNTDIYIYTVDGDKRFEGQYEKPVRLVIPTNSQSKYIFVTESSVDTVTLD